MLSFRRPDARHHHNALTVETTVGGETCSMTMEVELHIGDNLVRAIALKPTDGMQRGTEVLDTGPISVPVGDITKGHVWNALVTHSCSTLRPSPRLSAGRSTAPLPSSTSSSPRPRCLRPASKCSTYSPHVTGGKIGLFGGAGVGKTVLIQDDLSHCP
jgi:F-type H+-transporting ATPase subunit beta